MAYSYGYGRTAYRSTKKKTTSRKKTTPKKRATRKVARKPSTSRSRSYY